MIEDWCPPFGYRNPYAHDARIFSHKLDQARAFTWNPAYTLIFRHVAAHGAAGAGPDADLAYRASLPPDERTALQVLRKDMRTGWEVDNPFRHKGVSWLLAHKGSKAGGGGG